MSRVHALSLLITVVISGQAWSDKRPMTIEDMFAFKRVADPQISPDGKWVAYQVASVDLTGNKSSTNIWIAATDGKTPPRRLTSSTKADRHPRWSPDGSKILFESTRSGDSQLWVIDLSGGEARQLTKLSTGASSGIWSPDGKSIAFVSSVYPEFSEKPFTESDQLNGQKIEDAEKSPVKVKVFTRLFFRHWDEYVEDKRQHLYVMSAEGGEPRDVTPGNRDANPTSSTFSAGDDFTFTPDSKNLIFTAPPERDEAWSTNYDLCRVSTTNTSTKWETLTKDNAAADSSPRFSPDGGRFAWRVQQKADYEADQWDILVAECDRTGTLTGPAKSVIGRNGRLSANEFVWATLWERTDARSGVIFSADHKGSTKLFASILGGDTYDASLLTEGAHSSLSASSDGKNFAFSLAKMTAPAEVYVHGLSESEQRTPLNLSKANESQLAKLDLPRPESVDVPIEGDVKMQIWILKPPGFDATKKYPVAFLVHGGPQGAWEDGWSFRWNPSLWAAQGYVVVLPNPRGSTGFGQKFIDEISGDWGGKCYRDLVAALDYAEKLPFVDKTRIASAGASFGGYMMNWFAVNDIAPRFKCLIAHCSVWNFESMWGTTDELWFDEYEHGGLPWDKPEAYAKFSPHKKAGNLGKYKTPMLIVHNDNDFRCPIGQGHELFSALQRLKVPSRFVNFPDEGHWVLKPKNSERWHGEVFGWLKKYCPPGGK